MKYFNKTMLLLTVVFVSTTSCNDELEISPFDRLTTESSFNTVDDFNLALEGAYSQFIENNTAQGNGVYYGAVAMAGIPDILSDNVILAQAGRQSNRNNFEFNYTSVNNTGLINEAYEIINEANIIIGLIDNLPASADRDNILGEALAIRALAHFDLARTYAQIPTQSPDANASLGIPYQKVEDGDTGDPFALPSRDTVESNYDDLIGDLLQARDLVFDSNLQGRFTSNGVNALLARAYLYNGEYQNAIDASNLVTASIASIDNLPGVFTDANTDGLILSAPQDSALDNITIGVLWSQTADGNTISEYALDFAFLNQISMDDVRRNILTVVRPNADLFFNAINKVGIDVNGSVDAKLIRTAEVVLTRAEAQFNLGDEVAALATLDELRANRYFANAPSGETGQALEDAIQFERRVELAFESHRFFDIKRRGESVVRSTFGDLFDGSGTPPEVGTLPAGDIRFQYPIPLAEITNNPNFEQNPGY